MAKREENNVDWVEEQTGDKYAKCTTRRVSIRTPSCSVGNNVDWVAELTGELFAKPVNGAVGY